MVYENHGGLHLAKIIVIYFHHFSEHHIVNLPLLSRCSALAIARVAFCIDLIHMSVCQFLYRQNAYVKGDFLKNKQLKAMVSIDDP